jgi:hypothetical protein
MTAKRIRIAFWVLAILLGGAQTWYTRHRIFADGISYLEIAQAYARGDWHGALNAYWSPLYSWVVAAYLLVFRPSTYWQASSLHVVNFGAFLASCWIFEKFLNKLIQMRPQGLAGFSVKTVTVIGYAAILHGGLVMVGIGYVSPDMIAYFLTGLAGWLTLRIAGSESRQARLWMALGVTLGLAYLDRSSFAPISLIYIAATASLLMKKPVYAVRYAALCLACLVLTGGPFAVALTMQRGAFTLGESGKLNYGWEVDGAARSQNWQGEPGDIGKPLHPTRLILKSPVPVYEFGEPVGGSYPPWRDPSYWYAGIQPHLKIKEQMQVLAMNLRTTAIYLATTPAFAIFFVILLMCRGKGLGLTRWPPVFWVLTIPAAIGVGMFCLVFIDKRYIAGFFAVLWITVLAGIAIPQGRLAKYADWTAQLATLAFLIAMLVWLRPALTMGVQDLATLHEGEYNVAFVMAERFEKLGIKAGDRLAFVGTGISADWVRLLHAKVVVEMPLKWERGLMLLNTVDMNAEDKRRFFQLDDVEREKVYDAFRSAGAVIAIANTIPREGRQGDWVRLLDPNEPGYPTTGGQLLGEPPGYYRWLNR